MAWLYVPGTRALKSGSDVPDFPSGSCVTSRGKPMQQRTWRALWSRASWIVHLSGLICEPLMLLSGVSIFRSSLPGSPASRSPQLEAERTSKIRVGSGARLLGSFATYHPRSCSWRMSQGSLFADSLPYSLPLPHWGSMRNGALYERKTPERLTDGRAFSSSRLTPTKDAPTSGSFWPTPDALAKERINGGAGRSLEAERPTLALLAHMWPTPNCTDHKGSARPGQRRRQLSEAVEQKLEGTHLDPATKKDGSSTSDRVVLSPEFVEAIMGLPTGWTACDYSETE